MVFFWGSNSDAERNGFGWKYGTPFNLLYWSIIIFPFFNGRGQYQVVADSIPWNITPQSHNFQKMPIKYSLNERQERYLHYELFSSAAHSISAVLPAAMVFRPMVWQPGVTSWMGHKNRKCSTTHTLVHRSASLYLHYLYTCLVCVYIYNIYIYIYVYIYIMYLPITNIPIYNRRKFRSQTSDNMERWKSSQQGEESEEKRSEERRCRCAKR